MIPKIIHFCWFGGNPLPPLALECIASWRKYLPEYEIWQWGETSPIPSQGGGLAADRYMTFDVNSIPYTAEAYKQKKYAFVSDYCRFVAIYQYGGIYFDTDVEVIRPMDDIIAKGNFMGFEVDPDGENTPGRYAPRYCFDVALGLGFGMEKNHQFMKRMVDYYQTLKFELPPADITWYKTIVAYTTEVLCSMGLKNIRGIQMVEDITIYPREYFAPINVITGRLCITNNTHTIHRYMGSWNTDKRLTVKRLTVKDVKKLIRDLLPEWVFYGVNRIKRRRYKIQ